METKELMMKRLTDLAYKVSRPFCYECYEVAVTGRCGKCCSDDLMRELPGVGVEYGTDWVVKELLKDVESADTERLFEDSIRSCYSDTTKIGWLTYDTVSAIKELDPISWDLAKSEWLDAEDGEHLVSFDGANYYEISALERFLDEHESGKASA